MRRKVVDHRAADKMADPAVKPDDPVFRSVTSRNTDPLLLNGFEGVALLGGGPSDDEQAPTRNGPEQLQAADHVGIEVVEGTEARMHAYAGNGPVGAVRVATFRGAFEDQCRT